MDGLFPNPSFAQLTYQLSSLVWRSCYDRRPCDIASLETLRSFDAGFAAETSRFPRYPDDPKAPLSS